MNLTEHAQEIVSYFDYLETKYNEQFNIDTLTDTELVTMERLARDALEEHSPLSANDKSSIVPLLSLLEQHRRRREKIPEGPLHSLWV